MKTKYLSFSPSSPKISPLLIFVIIRWLIDFCLAHLQAVFHEEEELAQSKDDMFDWCFRKTPDIGFGVLYSTFRRTQLYEICVWTWLGIDWWMHFNMISLRVQYTDKGEEAQSITLCREIVFVVCINCAFCRPLKAVGRLDDTCVYLVNMRWNCVIEYRDTMDGRHTMRPTMPSECVLIISDNRFPVEIFN